MRLQCVVVMVLVSLLIGCIINLAIALLAARTNLPDTLFFTPEPRGVGTWYTDSKHHVSWHEAPLTCGRMCLFYSEDIQVFVQYLNLSDVDWSEAPYDRPIPYWVPPDQFQPIYDHTADYGIAAFGWPAHSLAYDWHQDVGTWRITLHHAITSRNFDPQMFPPLQGWILPTRILPIPTMLNTLLYGTATCLGYLLFQAVQRRIRRVRNRCADCGYDLRAHANAPCPECGR